MSQSGEVQSRIRESKWQTEMIKSKLFHEICDQHPRQRRRHFCCDCMIPPLCTTCYNKEKDDHKDHTVIETFRCSQETGVKVETMSKYMDISEIHTYRINGFQIVFIHQRGDNHKHRLRNNVSRKCQVCEWKFEVTSSALFCSVQCKLRSALGSQLDELMEKPEESRSALGSQFDEQMEKADESRSVLGSQLGKRMEKPEETELSWIAFVKSRRKGKPQRAPFN